MDFYAISTALFLYNYNNLYSFEFLRRLWFSNFIFTFSLRIFSNIFVIKKQRKILRILKISSKVKNLRKLSLKKTCDVTMNFETDFPLESAFCTIWKKLSLHVLYFIYSLSVEIRRTWNQNLWYICVTFPRRPMYKHWFSMYSCRLIISSRLYVEGQLTSRWFICFTSIQLVFRIG